MWERFLSLSFWSILNAERDGRWGKVNGSTSKGGNSIFMYDTNQKVATLEIGRGKPFGSICSHLDLMFSLELCFSVTGTSRKYRVVLHKRPSLIILPGEEEKKISTESPFAFSQGIKKSHFCVMTGRNFGFLKGNPFFIANSDFTQNLMSIWPLNRFFVAVCNPSNKKAKLRNH